MVNEFESSLTCGTNNEYVIQKYIGNPLLVNEKKFDFRVYMLIANIDPLVILYFDGFLRVSLSEYDIASNNEAAHVTNTALAK